MIHLLILTLLTKIHICKISDEKIIFLGFGDKK